MSKQGLALIQNIIRKQIIEDPTLTEGIGFEHTCRIFGLHDLIEDTSHQFITVALPNDYDLGKLDSLLTKKMQKWLHNATAVIENHSASGINLHVHILKLGNYNKTKIIRDLSRKFKIDRNFIDVKWSTERLDYINRQNYINGIKLDEEKRENCKLDREWRIENNLKEKYQL